MSTVKRDENGNRLTRFAPAYKDDGTPKYVRCYDNGGATMDRYTVVFSRLNAGWCHYLAMSENPFRGVGLHGEHPTAIDRPSYGHLGKKVAYSALPELVQRCVMQDYVSFWG